MHNALLQGIAHKTATIQVSGLFPPHTHTRMIAISMDESIKQRASDQQQ
jgi:hypothetical protein